MLHSEVVIYKVMHRVLYLPRKLSIKNFIVTVYIYNHSEIIDTSVSIEDYYTNKLSIGLLRVCNVHQLTQREKRNVESITSLTLSPHLVRMSGSMRPLVQSS